MGELFLPAHQDIESLNPLCIDAERIDLKRVQPGIERASEQTYAIDNVAECLSINWRVAAASTQQGCSTQLAQHSLNLVPLNGKDTHSYVFKDFRPDPAKPQREYKPPERIAHDAYKQLYACRSHWAHEHPFDLGSRTSGMHLLHHRSCGGAPGIGSSERQEGRADVPPAPPLPRKKRASRGRAEYRPPAGAYVPAPRTSSPRTSEPVEEAAEAPPGILSAMSGSARTTRASGQARAYRAPCQRRSGDLCVPRRSEQQSGDLGRC